MDDFIEVIKSIQMVQGTASTLVLQGAILDLATQLNELMKRVDGIKQWMDGLQEPTIGTDTKPQPDMETLISVAIYNIIHEHDENPHWKGSLKRILTDLINEVSR